MTLSEAPSTKTRNGSTDVDHRPGYLVKRLADDLRSCMEASLRSLDMTLPQYACMHHLYERPGISGAELARRAFVTRQAVYLILAELRDLGWVEREVRGNGVRQGAARLTALGRRKIEAAFDPVSEIENVMIDELTDAERRQFVDVLLRCDSALRRIIDSDV